MFDLPLDYYRKFVIEENFGFNKMTPSLYLGDMIKNALLGTTIGLPVLWILLVIMEKIRNMVVALRLDSLERFPVSDAFHLPDIHRPAIQQIFPPDR